MKIVLEIHVVQLLLAVFWPAAGYVVSVVAGVRGEFRPRQTRQLPRAVDLKGRVLSCQSY